MKYIISDVHGCYDTLMALLKKLPPEANSENIVFVGDLIDRGSDSRKVINFVRDGGYDVILGNHEDLILEAISDYVSHNVEVEYNRDWLQNGGRACLSNYQEAYGTDYESLIKDAEWINSLPRFKIYEEEDDRGRKLVVTHAVSIDFIDIYFDLMNKFKNSELSLEEKNQLNKMNELLIWNRNIPKTGSELYFNISGHNILDYFIFNDIGELKVKKENITKENILVDKDLGYACIDTGAFSKMDSYGNLNCSSSLDEVSANPYQGRMTCISFPDLKVIRQCNVEEFNWK